MYGSDFRLNTTDEFTFTFHMDAKTYKALCHAVGRGNNWRRSQGFPLIRVPVKERRKRK